MPRGGIRSTAFTSETAPKGKGSSKHNSTKLKERIGLSGWERLCDFILNEGSDKLVEEMGKLKEKDYVNSLGSLYEYVKPKLNRTTIEGDKDKPIQHVLRIEDARDCKPMTDESNAGIPG